MDLVESSLLKATAAMVVVLAVGILAGLAMDEARTDFLRDEIRDTELQTETFLVTQQYLRNSSNNYCRVMSDRIPEIADKNAQIGRDLEEFSSKSIGQKDEYQYLTNKYYINELRLYVMLQNYNARCDADANAIMFFFDGSMDSKRQGAVLTEYRENVDNQTYVFSYNIDADHSEILEMLKTDYEVRDGPVIVIDGNDVYREYVPLKRLKQVID
ncbi:hypothetical protein [Candidatus Nanohalococcus occultus]|uniref:hypothetical protein n=1 Tax=Candidatus Nanohalococcus occultus TaxID=2978047 RepID=UPI0039E0CE9D